MSLLDEITRLRAENDRLRADLDRARNDWAIDQILLMRYQAIYSDLLERIDHLLDQPLVILNGDAFVGSRDHQPVCLN